MQSLLSQATYLSKTVDEAGRKKLIDSLRDIAITLEDEQESAQRLLYSQYPLMALRLGCDIGLFNMLHEAAGPMGSSEIAEKTGVAPKLMGRLLRYMSSCRLIQETDKDTFTANNVTKTFCNPGFQGGVYHYFDYIGPGIKHLPDFLKKRGYTDVESVTDCPVPAAWGSDLPLFLHYQTVPELFEHFNNFMTVQRLGMPTWLTVYPYKEMASITNPERPLFVDVGGGFGHQSIALREALPNAPNKIILQDIPATLEKAIKHPGVEIMVQDFWKPQIIKNAKMYYMRNIIHDYPDEKAIEILRNTRDAMSADSVLLIDEMYLGTKDIHWQATQIDITMMTALSSIERTEEQWRDLIPKAGLKINKVYQYTHVLRDSIIECVRA